MQGARADMSACAHERTTNWGKGFEPGEGDMKAACVWREKSTQIDCALLWVELWKVANLKLTGKCSMEMHLKNGMKYPGGALEQMDTLKHKFANRWSQKHVIQTCLSCVPNTCPAEAKIANQSNRPHQSFRLSLMQETNIAKSATKHARVPCMCQWRWKPQGFTWNQVWCNWKCGLANAAIMCWFSFPLKRLRMLHRFGVSSFSLSEYDLNGSAERITKWAGETKHLGNTFYWRTCSFHCLSSSNKHRWLSPKRDRAQSSHVREGNIQGERHLPLGFTGNPAQGLTQGNHGHHVFRMIWKTKSCDPS